jgi:hypothetical protein
MSSRGFSRSVLERILPLPEREFTTAADVYLRCLAPLYGPVRSLPQVLARYRVHGANSYARSAARLDLGIVRQNVRYGGRVRRHIADHADRLGLPRPHGPMRSVADLGHRMISLKLEPEHHPIAADRVWRLALAGVLAPWGRRDLRWPIKVALTGWFLAIAVAPQMLAVALAKAFAVR